MNTEENEGGLMRDSVKRTLRLYYNYGHWRIDKPVGKEVNKVPEVPIPIQTLKPFMRQLLTEIELWVGFRPYTKFDKL